MKLFTFFYLFLIVSLCGCVGSLERGLRPVETEVSSTEGEKSALLAVFELSTPKTTYSTQEVIPLEINIQNGKFDLLVPFSTVSTQRVFKQLTVTDSNGEIVRMKRPLPPANTLKTLYQDGESVRCVQGFDLKAGATQKVSLENLQKHYQLEPGNYTVKVTIVLEVYNEFFQDQHPQVIELEREIQEIQNNPSPQFTPEVKKEAISYTQDQIEFIKEKYKDELQNIYLPLNSSRGKTSLESNAILVTIK